MKKLLCSVILFLILFTSMPVYAELSDAEAQLIHDTFADYSVADLEQLINLAKYELEYRGYSVVDKVNQKDDNYTQKLICNYFENIGLKIKYVMFQPLVEKDPGGLYGGEERWFVTFESGEQIGTWISNDQITYCYKNQWYNDVPLY